MAQSCYRSLQTSGLKVNEEKQSNTMHPNVSSMGTDCNMDMVFNRSRVHTEDDKHIVHKQESRSHTRRQTHCSQAQWLVKIFSRGTLKQEEHFKANIFCFKNEHLISNCKLFLSFLDGTVPS